MMKSILKIPYYYKYIRYLSTIFSMKILCMTKRILYIKIVGDFGELLGGFRRINPRLDHGLFNLIVRRNILSLNVSLRRLMMILAKVVLIPQLIFVALLDLKIKIE
jgi:hypothetical protein